jgi:hypothetical protein
MWLPMTEAEWWAATEPCDLIEWLSFNTPASTRKLRLFAVACCNEVATIIDELELSHLLGLAENFADGLVDQYTLLAANQDCWSRYPLVIGRGQFSAGEAALRACLEVTRADEAWRNSNNVDRWLDDIPAFWVSCCVADAVSSSPDENESNRACRIEYARQVRLLHDIFGPLPFRDLAIAPEWLTSHVLALARGIYDDKAFDRMPILADALQDAGCNNDEILTHCRVENWEHVRGCWVLDLLLGRPWCES